MVAAEGARLVLGQRVAVALAVRGPHERGNHVEVPVVNLGRLGPEVGETEVDVELEKLDSGGSPWHAKNVARGSDGSPAPAAYSRLRMGAIRVGPARLPSRDSPESAVELLLARGYDACELDFEGGFWMDKPFAEHLGECATDRDVALSVHAPLAAFLGHVEREAKYRRAMGMLDHSAGIAQACGAELVVFHPGYLLGREREGALDDVVEQLGELHERLQAKGRAVPFGVEVMGRVRELGSAEDVVEIAQRTGWVRPVLDFAHLHAVSDGGFADAQAFAAVLEDADQVLPEGAPFHVHFSDIAYANRNETKHLSYGEGTLRAEPLRDALAAFSRPATVISESPDEASSQTIRSILAAAV